MKPERVPPSDVPMERLVLGSVIVDSASNAAVLERLSPRDFAIDWHRTIFDRLQQMHRGGEPIDRVTVAYSLQKSGDLDRVGGVGYLTDLDNGLPRIPHVERYVELLQEKRQLREYMTVFERLSEQCSQGRHPHEVMQLARESLSRLEQPQPERYIEARREPAQERNWFERFWDWANTPLGSKALQEPQPERISAEPVKQLASRDRSPDVNRRQEEHSSRTRLNGREYERIHGGEKLVVDRLPQLGGREGGRER